MNPDRTTPPAIGEIGNITLPDVRKLTLDNGMPLIVLDRGTQDVNRLTVVSEGGFAESPVAGVSTLASNMMRHGAAGMSSARIGECLDYNGARLVTQDHFHHSSLGVYALNSRTSETVALLSDIYSDPTFPENEFISVRNSLVVKAQVNQEKVDQVAAARSSERLMGAAHPLARTYKPDEVQNINREDLVEFQRRFYNPANATIYLAGRITPGMEDAINDRFGVLEPTGTTQGVKLTPFTPEASKGLETIERKDALQSGVNVSFPAVPRTHPHYQPLRVAVTALGGYFGSRLMSNIREDKGYTYGISAYLAGYPDGAIVNIVTETDNRYLTPLLSELDVELRRLAEEPLSADEMNRLRQYVLSTLASSVDTPFAIMDQYINRQIVAIPDDYFRQQLETIRSITSAQIAEMARTYLRPNQAYITTAGN